MEGWRRSGPNRGPQARGCRLSSPVHIGESVPWADAARARRHPLRRLRLPMRGVPAAHAERHRQLRARRAADRPEDNPALVHGKSTYVNHGCRCERLRRGTARVEPAAAEPGPAGCVSVTDP